MVRRLLDVASVLSLLLALACALTWLWHGTHNSHDYFGVGRGYRTLALDTWEASARLTYTHYTSPLTDDHSLAPFIHRRAYGWFVGDAREWGLVAGHIRLLKIEADYETRPEVFFTQRVVQLPYWLWILVLGPLPAARLTYRFARHRSASRRGFPVTASRQ